MKFGTETVVCILTFGAIPLLGLHFFAQLLGNMNREKMVNMAVLGFGTAAVVYCLYKLLSKKTKKPGQKIIKNEFQPYKLIKKENLTHDVRRFTFELEDTLGLPVGGHITLRIPGVSTEDGDILERPYTPTTSENDKGFFQCVIKIYNDGRFTPHLDKVKVGDFVEVRGPIGRIRYPAPGTFVKKMGKKTETVTTKQLNMICGGTGITPMLQLVNQIMSDSNDLTKISMIFGNKTDDDMLCYDYIEEVKQQAKSKGREFSCWYTLDNPPPGWIQGSGFVSANMISEQCYPPSDDTVTVLCGPPGMVKGCRKALESLGHQKKQVIPF